MSKCGNYNFLGKNSCKRLDGAYCSPPHEGEMITTVAKWPWKNIIKCQSAEFQTSQNDKKISTTYFEIWKKKNEFLIFGRLIFFSSMCKVIPIMSFKDQKNFINQFSWNSSLNSFQFFFFKQHVLVAFQNEVIYSLRAMYEPNLEYFVLKRSKIVINTKFSIDYFSILNIKKIKFQLRYKSWSAILSVIQNNLF